MATKDTKKEVTGSIKLLIAPGKANPSPPVGPALGQKGVNIMDFCKAFNDRTKKMDPSMAIPVVITVYKDRSFDFVLKTPKASTLILAELGVSKGSSEANHGAEIGILTQAQLEKIAKIKMPDLTAADLKAAKRTIAGTARSMGVKIEGEI
jgi:large subunit ribosomal protein L11